MIVMPSRSRPLQRHKHRLELSTSPPKLHVRGVARSRCGDSAGKNVLASALSGSFGHLPRGAKTLVLGLRRPRNCLLHGYFD